MIQKYKLWVFLAVVLLDFLAVFAFYQTRPLYKIDLGVTGDSWYIQKFYLPEKNEQGPYRWSQDGSKAVLPAVGAPYQVGLEATAYRPEGTPPPAFDLELSNSGLKAGFQGAPDNQNYIFPVGSKADFSLGIHELTIDTPTFQPSTTDDRQLGLLVRHITVQAQPNSFGFVVPPIMAWLSLSLGMALTQALAFSTLLKLRQRQAYLGLGVLALPVGLLVLALGNPEIALENAFPVGMGLFFLGVAGLALNVLPRWRKTVCAVLLAVAALGVLFNVFNYVGLAVFSAGFILLALVHNPRLKHSGFNLLIVANVAMFPAWGFLQQRFYQTIDAESHHLYWLNELDLMVKEGDFFPRWAPHFSYERGSTVFTFYAPLSRYISEFFILGGLGPAIAFLAAFLVITVGSGLSIYWLARDFLGGPGAVVAAIAYLYHPYRLADFYQRGDIAEALNFVFFPLAFLAVSRAMRFNRPAGLGLVVGGGVAFGFMLISHQLSAFYFGIFLLAPFVLLCLVRYAWQERNAFGAAVRKAFVRLLYLAGMVGLGVGLSAFYILPVVFESKNIRVGNKVGIDWGYGFFNPEVTNWRDWFSSIRPNEYADRSMTNLAWFGPTFLVLALVGLVALWLPFSRKGRDNRWFALFAGLLIVVMLAMQFQFFRPFWENTPGMIYIQFPWRLMIYIALLASVLIGGLADFLFKLAHRTLLRWQNFSAQRTPANRRKLRVAYPAGLVVLFLLALLLGYSGAGKVSLTYYPQSFTGKYSLGTLINQIENGDIFYLPNWARSLDTLEKEPDRAYIERGGQAQSDTVTFKRVKSANYEIQVNATAPGNLVIPVFYFDGWTLTANGQTFPTSFNQPQGYIQANVPAGNYTLSLKFENSLPRAAGTGLTIVALLGLVGFAIYRRRRQPAPSRPLPVKPDLEKVASGQNS